MQIVGIIHDNFHGNALTSTHEAWQVEVELLQDILQPWQKEDAQILFEYNIPRLGKRIDVVLLLHGLIFCLEFKVGQKTALQSDVEQVMDYALDLKTFIVIAMTVPSSQFLFQPTIRNHLNGSVHPFMMMPSIMPSSQGRQGFKV